VRWLEYESPWVDSSGMDEDDMYEPIPFFGPSRLREAWICALKALGPIVAFFLLPSFGWLIAEKRGCYLGSAIGVVAWVLATQRDEKGNHPNYPCPLGP